MLNSRRKAFVVYGELGIWILKEDLVGALDNVVLVVPKRSLENLHSLELNATNLIPLGCVPMNILTMFKRNIYILSIQKCELNNSLKHENLLRTQYSN